MSAVAAEAGVATGTAYTHYASKDELVLAAYRETKAELAAAATAGLDRAAGPAERFKQLWLAAYRHLAANREHALFLLQVDCSPYRDDAHEAALAAGDDPLLREAASPDIAARLLPLPLEVLYELGPGARGAARRERHRARRRRARRGGGGLLARRHALAPSHRRRVALAFVPRRHGRIANGARGIEMEGTSPRRKSGVRIFGTDANWRSS